jgi:hypothetical protein
MRAIALSLLLIFTTFTVVLCSYFIWQDSDFTVVMPVEEEEDHSKSCSIQYNVFFTSHKNNLDFHALNSEALSLNAYKENKYEDVLQNTLFSPPDGYVTPA